jgi:transposase, IS5 family
MRYSVQKQQKLVPIPVEHQHAAELNEMSRTLDDHREVNKLVLEDLIAGGINPDKGRTGMSAEQVLRVLIIKQMNDFSYERLAFHVMDSDRNLGGLRRGDQWL